MKIADFTTAVIAVGDTVRQHTTDASDAVAILAAACAFDACNSKADDATWAEIEADLVRVLRQSFAVSRDALTKHAPHG